MKYATGVGRARVAAGRNQTGWQSESPKDTFLLTGNAGLSPSNGNANGTGDWLYPATDGCGHVTDEVMFSAAAEAGMPS